MKNKLTLLLILIGVYSCTPSEHHKHITATEYEIGFNTPDTSDDRFEYVLQDLDFDIDVPNKVNNTTYYTYTSKNAVVDFKDVQWVKSDKKPEFDKEEFQEQEIDIEVDELNPGLQQEISEDPQGFGEEADVDAGSDSGSDSGSDGGDGGGGDGGGD